MPSEYYSLPGKRVSLNGAVYFIHGLVHGNPLVRINPSFKKNIGQRLKNLHVLCEDGFTSWIPNGISMNEVDYFSLNKFSFFEQMRSLGFFIHSYLASLNRKSEPEILSRVRRMDSIEDLIEIREELFKDYLPEPEGMNLLMKKANSGSVDSPAGNIPLRVKRYIYEAKTAQEYTRKDKWKELHIVVGCAHELPLEYLLKHPQVLDCYLI